jgi:putative heme-binding domain-containing protein
MLKDWQHETMPIAFLSSVVPHLDRVLREAFHSSDNKPPPPGLAARLVELVCQEPRETVLTDVLGEISQSVTRGYADWQMAGLAGLVEALDRRSLTLAAFQQKSSPPVQEALAKLGPLFDQARRVAPDNQSTESERLVAIRLLGRQSSDQQQRDISLLGELLGPQNPGAVQTAALDGLRRSRGPQTAQVLLRSWRGYGPNQRQAVLNALFNRPEWTSALVAALEAGKIQPAELGALPQQQLLKNADSNVRERSVRLFSEISIDRKKIVEAYKDVAQLPGNRANGHELFVKNCSICHRLRGEGQNIGPDLGTITEKPVQELVVAILDPNQAVDPAYTAYTAVTKDDREFSGVLASETATSIVLKLAGGAEEQILRADLKELTSAGRSLMPEGFEAGLKQQDLADLIAYMLNPGP